jgi:hypothetical protein
MTKWLAQLLPKGAYQAMQIRDVVGVEGTAEHLIVVHYVVEQPGLAGLQREDRGWALEQETLASTVTFGSGWPGNPAQVVILTL